MIQRLAIYTSPTINLTFVYRHFALCAIAALLALVSLFQGQAAARAFEEYQLKAVFLYRLSLFITWPDQTFIGPDQPFVIGILGDDPFGEHIDRVVKNEKVVSRPIRVQRYASMKDVSSTPCQMLFISRALGKQWPHIKKQLQHHSMLTVSDMDQFGQMGGMVTIQTQNKRIKLEINAAETRRAGLVVSSKLLKVARRVQSDDQKRRQ